MTTFLQHLQPKKQINNLLVTFISQLNKLGTGMFVLQMLQIFTFCPDRDFEAAAEVIRHADDHSLQSQNIPQLDPNQPVPPFMVYISYTNWYTYNISRSVR